MVNKRRHSAIRFALHQILTAGHRNQMPGKREDGWPGRYSWHDFGCPSQTWRKKCVACFATVQNGTAWLSNRRHAGSMLHRKDKKKTDNATQASVKKEMAKPRMARFARIADLNMNPARIRQQPSAIMPGTVDKIIASPDPRRKPGETWGKPGDGRDVF
jgi:hypothetical protein